MKTKGAAVIALFIAANHAAAADFQSACAIPAGVQYTVGVSETPMTTLFPVAVMVAFERPFLTRQLSQLRVAEVLNTPAVKSGRFPEINRLSSLGQGTNITIDRRIVDELQGTVPRSGIHTVSIGSFVEQLRRNTTARVIGEEKSEKDINLRFDGKPGAFSAIELERRRGSKCSSNLYDEFKAAAEALTRALGARDYHEVPLRLVNAKRIPAKQGDANFAAIKNFESKYEKLLDGCTTANIDLRINQRVGRLTIGENVCTALRIAPSHIATNRHCLFSENGSPILGVSAINVKVDFQDPARREIPVCGVVQLPSSQLQSVINPSNDFLVLRIGDRDESIGKVELLSNSEIRAGINQPTELELVSVWPGSGALKRSAGLDMVSYTGGYCFVVKKGGDDGNGCFLHQCGSLPGGSGAPVFERPAGNIPAAGSTLRVAGFHRGDSSDRSSSSPCREELPGIRSNNAATTIPKEVLNALR